VLTFEIWGFGNVDIKYGEITLRAVVWVVFYEELSISIISQKKT
jgi:hypothetical protein